MTPIDWAIRPFLNYFNWTGRATRAEFWWFTLLNFIVSTVCGIIDGLVGDAFLGNMGMVSLVAFLFFLIPGIMVSIRRLHDTDRSGFWLFIVLIPLIGVLMLLYFDVSSGTSGPNRFGDDPYYDPSRHQRFA